ncbi:MAG: hypothetical protein MUQ30_00425, partial [Anaerolineae bacterium]|nr:hypothetical protein [Anaerolineae bacterium]
AVTGVGTGVQHQVGKAKLLAPLRFIDESFYGSGVECGLGGCDVDEIGGVGDDRVHVCPGSSLLELLDLG